MSKLFFKVFWKSCAWMPATLMFVFIGHHYGVLPWGKDMSPERATTYATLCFGLVFFEMSVYLFRMARRSGDEVGILSKAVLEGKRYEHALIELERRLASSLIEFWYDQKLQSSAHAHKMREHREGLLIGFVQDYKLPDGHRALIDELMKGAGMPNVSPRGVKRIHRLAFLLAEIARGKYQSTRHKEFVAMLEE